MPGPARLAAAQARATRSGRAARSRASAGTARPADRRAVAQARAASASSSGPPAAWRGRRRRGGSFSDFFHMMFGDEGAAAGEPERFRAASGENVDELLARLGMAGTGAGAGTNAGGTRARPAPIEVTAEISLEESFHGTSRIVELEGRRLEVTLPRGAATGSRIKLTGKGPGGRDLVVVTKLKPHRAFTRRGDDLEREVPVTMREALLGGEIPVATLKGRVLLKVPSGTQNGRMFRLKGQGMPAFKGDATGDLFVRIRVVLPTELSDEAKAAASTLADLIDQPDPRA